jgi:hypothetical protein
VNVGNERGYQFKGWQLAVALVLGTVVRVAYGFSIHAWYGAPDQLAWGLSLSEMLQHGHWNYFQTIHAPHEGGSLIIGLLALLLSPFQFIMPPLSLAALLIDLVSRLIQIRVVGLVNKTAAPWYAAWTVFAVPALVPWGTVNFGLHALAGFFPFLIIYIGYRWGGHKYLALILAGFCALSLSVSYDNLVLVPVGLLLILLISHFRVDLHVATHLHAACHGYPLFSR